MLIISTTVQYGIIFGIVLAAIGVVLSGKADLWKEFRFYKRAAVTTAIISIVAALALFPGDKLIFGHFNSWIRDQYNVSPGLPKIIFELLVGGVIEEVMMLAVI